MFPNTVQRKWDSYWFTGTGRFSLAVARIAVGLSALLSYRRFAVDYRTYLDSHVASLYQPKGVLRFFGDTPPPVELFSTAESVAWLCLPLFMLGVWPRLTGTLALVAHLVMVSLLYSFAPSWTHGFPIVYLAWLAIVWGPHADAPLIPRGQNPRQEGTAWPVLLGQAVLATCFFGAALWKIRSDPLMAWAWSDNLRHQLMTRYEIMGEAPSAIAVWLSAEPWRYRLAGAVNLLAQIAPMIAVFSRRPALRALGGAFWVLEVFGLGIVMHLFNWHWLPLAAFFVDWDALLPATKSAGTAQGVPHRFATAFIVLFLGIHGAVLFTDPTLSRRWNAFPFTNFRLYSDMKAKRSYDTHLTYEWAVARFQVYGLDATGQAAAEPHIRRSMRSDYFLFQVTQPRLLGAYAEQFARLLTTEHVAGAEMAEVRLVKQIVQVPAVGDGADLAVLRSGLAAVWKDGRIRAAGVRRFRDAKGADCLQFEFEGPPARLISWHYSTSLVAGPMPMPLPPNGTAHCFDRAIPHDLYIETDVQFDGLELETYLTVPLRIPAQHGGWLGKLFR